MDCVVLLNFLNKTRFGSCQLAITSIIQCVALPAYHGTSGPVKVADAAETPELTDAVLEAAQEIGDEITDVNGKNQIG